MSAAITPLAPTTLALLCVDLQPVFLKVIPDHERVTKRCAFAIAVAAEFGIRTIFSEQVSEKLGPTLPELSQLAKSSLVFSKKTFSAVADDPIRSALLTAETEHVLLCGIETSVCVYQSALDLLAAGVGVTVLSDCIGSRRSHDAQVCVEALVRAGANLLPSETVFYALLHDVKHPFFKAYTQLVKAYS